MTLSGERCSVVGVGILNKPYLVRWIAQPIFSESVPEKTYSSRGIIAVRSKVLSCVEGVERRRRRAFENVIVKAVERFVIVGSKIDCGSHRSINERDSKTVQDS